MRMKCTINYKVIFYGPVSLSPQTNRISYEGKCSFTLLVLLNLSPKQINKNTFSAFTKKKLNIEENVVICKHSQIPKCDLRIEVRCIIISKHLTIIR